VYVLVFDPADQESRTAYLMAQAIVRAETTGSTDAIGTQGGSLGTPGPARTSTTPETPANRPDSTATPGASGANRENERGQNTQRSATPHSSEALSGMGERVKVTGRVIEREGVQAIAVQRVERQHGDSTAAVSTTPRR
jgi:hypothetical protein